MAGGGSDRGVFNAEFAEERRGRRGKTKSFFFSAISAFLCVLCGKKGLHAQNRSRSVTRFTF